MNAQEKLIEYASKYNNGKVLTNEEFVGQMVVKGVAINRTPSSKTIARAQRDGKTITVTETVVTETSEIVEGRMVFGKSETTTEVLRIEL